MQHCSEYFLLRFVSFDHSIVFTVRIKNNLISALIFVLDVVLYAWFLQLCPVCHSSYLSSMYRDLLASALYFNFSLLNKTVIEDTEDLFF